VGGLSGQAFGGASAVALASSRFGWSVVQPSTQSLVASDGYLSKNGVYTQLNANTMVGGSAIDPTYGINFSLATNGRVWWPESKAGGGTIILGNPALPLPVANPFIPSVLVCRHMMAFTWNTIAAANFANFGYSGIACVFLTQGNAGWGGGGAWGTNMGSTGTFAFLGLARQVQTGNWYVARKRNGAIVQLVALPNGGLSAPLYVSGQPIYVEHRLFGPTPTAPARYELWLAQQRVYSVDGTDADFPAIDANTKSYRWMPAASDPAAGLTGGVRIFPSGEVFTCGNDAEALRYE
jgi:hypothetical protein